MYKIELILAVAEVLYYQNLTVYFYFYFFFAKTTPASRLYRKMIELRQKHRLKKFISL